MNRNKQFEDFFKGNMSQSEAVKFSDWLESVEGKQFLDSKFQSTWEKEDRDEYPEWDRDLLLEKINVGKSESKATPSHERDSYVNSRNGNSSWYRIAAILIIILAVPFVFYKLNSSDSMSVESSVALKIITRNNPAGVKSKFQLPDGSLVSLNSESTITFSEDFAVNRSIELIGEAYFSVAKDSLHPFIVESKGVSTEALGTIFNIKAYEDESSVEVLLVEGKVQVENLKTSEAMLLTPGEKASVQKSDGELIRSKGNVVLDTQWRVGVLEFSNIYFAEIFKRLERWYGVEIEVTGQMTSAKGFGKFKEGETLENVLNVLSYSNDFKYQIDNHKVYVDFNQ